MNIFLAIGIILIVLWLFGVFLYPLGGLIHILLILGVLAIVFAIL
jgi:hypothetical protein